MADNNENYIVTDPCGRVLIVQPLGRGAAILTIKERDKIIAIDILDLGKLGQWCIENKRKTKTRGEMVSPHKPKIDQEERYVK